MKPNAPVLGLLLLAATRCARPRPAPPGPNASPEPLPIAVTTMRSAYGIQLRLDGSVRQRGDWLYVVVPHGEVRTYQGTAPAWDLLLRAGLATCTGPGRWAVVSESRAARLAPLVGLTRDSSLLDATGRAFQDTLRLDLGVPAGTDMSRSWVTFEVAWPIGGELATYTVPTGATLGAAAPSANRGGTGDQACRG